MAPASNEEQFKFLISCIRYSNNGKVDFGQVAQECKIVSKGAAAKRYERMMRSHGIAPNAATIKATPSRTPKAERSESNDRPPKKRKADAYMEDNTTADDEEDFANVKADPTNDKEHLGVKEEPGQLSLGEAANLMQYYSGPSYSPQLGGDETYGGGEYESNTGFSSNIGAAYGLQTQQPYEFAFSPASMNSVPRSSAQGLQYQPVMHYSTQVDSQGGSESPLVVE